MPTEGLPTLKYSNLHAAIENLKIELSDFDNHFISKPLDNPINPTMGELNYQEWVKFHNKHFKHHFRQFRLL